MHLFFFFNATAPSHAGYHTFSPSCSGDLQTLISNTLTPAHLHFRQTLALAATSLHLVRPISVLTFPSASIDLEDGG